MEVMLWMIIGIVILARVVVPQLAMPTSLGGQSILGIAFCSPVSSSPTAKTMVSQQVHVVLVKSQFIGEEAGCMKIAVAACQSLKYAYCNITSSMMAIFLRRYQGFDFNEEFILIMPWE